MLDDGNAIQQNDCCICLDNFYNNKKGIVTFKCCKGNIHKSCLSLLFANNIKKCPLCRQDLKILSYYWRIYDLIHNYKYNDIIIDDRYYHKNIETLYYNYYREIFDLIRYIIYWFLLIVLCILVLITVLFYNNNKNKNDADSTYNKMNNLENSFIDYY